MESTRTGGGGEEQPLRRDPKHRHRVEIVEDILRSMPRGRMLTWPPATGSSQWRSSARYQVTAMDARTERMPRTTGSSGSKATCGLFLQRDTTSSHPRAALSPRSCRPDRTIAKVPGLRGRCGYAHFVEPDSVEAGYLAITTRSRGGLASSWGNPTALRRLRTRCSDVRGRRVRSGRKGAAISGPPRPDLLLLSRSNDADFSRLIASFNGRKRVHARTPTSSERRRRQRTCSLAGERDGAVAKLDRSRSSKSVNIALRVASIQALSCGEFVHARLIIQAHDGGRPRSVRVSWVIRTISIVHRRVASGSGPQIRRLLDFRFEHEASSSTNSIPEPERASARTRNAGHWPRVTGSPGAEQIVGRRIASGRDTGVGKTLDVDLERRDIVVEELHRSSLVVAEHAPGRPPIWPLVTGSSGQNRVLDGGMHRSDPRLGQPCDVLDEGRSADVVEDPAFGHAGSTAVPLWRSPMHRVHHRTGNLSTRPSFTMRNRIELGEKPVHQDPIIALDGALHLQPIEIDGPDDLILGLQPTEHVIEPGRPVTAAGDRRGLVMTIGCWFRSVAASHRCARRMAW